MNKPRLMTPGPAPVPADVLLEMARPLIHHRSDQAKSWNDEIVAGLRYVFQTSNDVLILTSSGTGAMEAAMVNTVPRGGKAIVLDAGWFASRWGVIARTFGIEVVTVATDWGHAVDPDDVRQALADHPDAVTVFGTLSETSTGTGHPVAAIGAVVARTSALFVVDGISGVGAMECRTDDWGIDVLCVGSQKALMLPPGLAFVAVSPQAWAQIDSFDSPSYYFNLKAARKSARDSLTPYTPAHTSIAGLRIALGQIQTEGIEAVWSRHSRMSQACRRGVEALGLDLYSTSPAEGMTVFRVPDGLTDAAIRSGLAERFGITVIGGQDKLKGQIIRVGHMGYTDEIDVVAALAALELVLHDLGHPVEPGAGVAAAQRSLMDSPAATSAGR